MLEVPSLAELLDQLLPRLDFISVGTNDAITWIRFGIWLAVGLVFYFLYGFKHSVLRTGKPR